LIAVLDIFGEPSRERNSVDIFQHLVSRISFSSSRKVEREKVQERGRRKKAEEGRRRRKDGKGTRREWRKGQEERDEKGREDGSQ